jgi:hypothetical protein
MKPEVYKILKQLSKDIRETATIQGNIEENVFLQYCEKLWKTTNTNDPDLVRNSMLVVCYCSINFIV